MNHTRTGLPASAVGTELTAPCIILQRRATFQAILLRWLDSEGKTLIPRKKLSKNQLQVNHLSA